VHEVPRAFVKGFLKYSPESMIITGVRGGVRGDLLFAQ
jgi:hypothetical protein